MMAKAFSLTGQWFAGDPAVSEKRALPPRSPDRRLMLTRIDPAASLAEESLRPRHQELIRPRLPVPVPIGLQTVAAI
jgi:hypothetical protein